MRKRKNESVPDVLIEQGAAYAMGDGMVLVRQRYYETDTKYHVVALHRSELERLLEIC